MEFVRICILLSWLLFDQHCVREGYLQYITQGSDQMCGTPVFESTHIWPANRDILVMADLLTELLVLFLGSEVFQDKAAPAVRVSRFTPSSYCLPV